MYWTDDNSNRIWMANLNGTRATIMISTRLSCPGWNIYVRSRRGIHLLNYSSQMVLLGIGLMKSSIGRTLALM